MSVIIFPFAVQVLSVLTGVMLIISEASSIPNTSKAFLIGIDLSCPSNDAKRPGISAVSTLVPSEAIFIKAPRNEKKINAEQTADKKCLLSSEPAAVPPVCRNESPFLFVFDISKLKLHHTPFKLILSYDEHIFGYRVRTPNAILIRNDKQRPLHRRKAHCRHCVRLSERLRAQIRAEADRDLDTRTRTPRRIPHMRTLFPTAQRQARAHLLYRTTQRCRSRAASSRA